MLTTTFMTVCADYALSQECSFQMLFSQEIHNICKTFVFCTNNEVLRSETCSMLL